MDVMDPDKCTACHQLITSRVYGDVKDTLFVLDRAEGTDQVMAWVITVHRHDGMI